MKNINFIKLNSINEKQAKSKSNDIEILCIGTEILLGNIINSNAKWLSEELAFLGLNHFRQTVIGDNKNRLENVILESAKRSRVLITTGGLGPTPDDLTTEAITNAFKGSLKFRKEIWLDIQEKFKTRNPSIPNSNKKQAFLPEGAQILPNKTGTAPGMIWTPIAGFTIITFPGVPSEMKQMWLNTAVPWLKQNLGFNNTFTSKILRFSGISESKLAEKVNDLLAYQNPTVAPYASLGEVKLRITAKSNNLESAEKLLLPVVSEIRKRTGTLCFGSDSDSIASIVLDLLRKRGETLAVAESCTGGGVGSELTAIPGSSDVFLGGVIAYQNSIKQKLLDVPKELLDKYGAVSEEVANAMAEGVLKKFNSDWSIAVTGIAGPDGGSLSKPVGLVQFCIKNKKGMVCGPKNFNSKRGRANIQKLSVLNALDQLRIFLLTTK